MAIYAGSTAEYGIGYPALGEASSSNSEERAAETIDTILEMNDRMHEPEGFVISEGTYVGTFSAGDSDVALNTLMATIPYSNRKLLVDVSSLSWDSMLDNTTYWCYATVVPASATQLYSTTVTEVKIAQVAEPAVPANSILLCKAVTTGAAITVTSTEALLGTATAKQWFHDMWTHRTASPIDHPDASVTNIKIAAGIDPEKIDDYSTDAAEMQTTADPYPGAAESLATDLTGELARIRYLIKQLSGEAQWYIDPDTDMTSIAAHIADTTDPHGAAMSVSTSITTPLVIGGTSTTSDLSLQTTSGVGAAGADMHFLVGNNGATEAMTILNGGNVGIGINLPLGRLHVDGSADDQQLIVQGHATQTTNILEVWNNAAQVLVSVSNNGGLVVNEQGDAAGDTRIESANNANLVTVVASEDEVNIGDGGTTDYTQIDTVGAVTYEGAARPLGEEGFKMGSEGPGIRLPATSGASMSSTGDAQGKWGICEFVNGSTTYLDISTKAPGNWVGDLNVVIELIWDGNAAVAGDVDWGVAFGASADGETTAPTLSAFTTGTFVTNGSANFRNTSVLTLIAPDIQPEDMVLFRLERLGGADTMADTARLFFAHVQFLVES